VGFRKNRLEEELKREITDILQMEIKDPRISKLTSVTDVELSGDLRYAKVYVSVMGSEEERRNTLEGLKKATGFIRSEIGKRIKLRYTPEITFHLDLSIQRGIEITQLLKKVQSDEGVGEE